MKTTLLGFLVFFAVCIMPANKYAALADDSTLVATDLERVIEDTVAPDFSLESLEGDRVKLSNYRDQKNTILIFFRGYW